MASSLTYRAALLLAASLSPVFAASSTATSTFNYMTEPAYTEGCHADNPEYTNPAFAASCERDSGITSLNPQLSSELTAYEATASSTSTFNIETEAAYTEGCHADNPLYSNSAFAASCRSIATETSFPVGGAGSTMSSAAVMATTTSVTTALTAFTGAAASRGVAVEAVAAALGLVGVVLL